MAVNKKLLVKKSTAFTPSEHFGVVLYEGDGSSSHSINGGKFGAAGFFENSGVIQIPDNITNTNEHSFSVWFNVNDASGNQTLLEIDTGNRIIFRIASTDANKANFGNGGWFNHGLSFSANQWYHLAITFKSGSPAKIYVDGSLQYTTGNISKASYGSNNYLGAANGSGSGSVQGKIDQFRVFQKELSSSEVSTLYAETASTVTDVTPLGDNDGVSIGGLQGAYNTYRFEDSVNDENSNNNGTAYNITYDSNGKFSKAASFNGSTSYIDLGTVSRASSMTLSAWVKTSGNNLPIVYLDNGTVFRINIESSGNAGGSNLSGTDLSGSTPVNDNNWHHILAVFNDGSGNKLLYVDGVLENSQSYSSGSRTYKDGIGIDNTNPAGAAILIDQVRIFRTALTPGQVKAVYTENSLTASYRFEGNANDDMNIADGTASNVTYEYGLNFTPDLVWLKERSAAESHRLFDTTRGATKRIFPDNNNAESTASDSLTSFDTGGFTVGSSAAVNQDGEDYVAWCWKAKGGTTTSVSGTNITSATQQVNTDIDFSITQFTEGSSGTSAVPHGLSGTPDMYIVKRTGGSQDWYVWHNGLSAGNSYIILNSTAAQGSNNNMWTQVDSTNINLGAWNTEGGGTKIIYAFKNVDGFSKFGSYTGNGSADGPIVETGFEPAFLMIKNTSSTESGGADWLMYDNKRSTTNPRDKRLYASANYAEAQNDNYDLDFLSNGFQIKSGTSNYGYNNNGDTYIYMAFAADPDTEAPTVAKSFTTITYTGTGSAQSIDGFGFKPNLLYIKRRTGASGPNMTNSVTGIDFYMFTDSTSNFGTDVNHLGSFDDDGFTTAGGGNAVNGSGEDYVAWAWKADDNEPTINTEGSIDSIVSANANAGFSIVKYEGTSAAATVGHGLSSAPEMIIVKKLDAAQDWWVYHKDLNGGTNPAHYFIRLNLTNAETLNASSGGSIWNSTAPTSTVFSTGTTLQESSDYIAYCFHSVSGFSKIGSYTGTGSEQLINTGFAVDFVLIKSTTTTQNWMLYDNVRGDSKYLIADSSGAEGSPASNLCTFESNGFKVYSSNSENQSGQTYIYMAFKIN